MVLMIDVALEAVRHNNIRQNISYQATEQITCTQCYLKLVELLLYGPFNSISVSLNQQAMSVMRMN